MYETEMDGVGEGGALDNPAEFSEKSLCGGLWTRYVACFGGAV
jgi:hypothetical protein